MKHTKSEIMASNPTKCVFSQLLQIQTFIPCHPGENTGKQNTTFLVDGKNNEFFNNFIFGTSLRMYSCMLFFLFPRFHPRFLSYNVKFNINCFKRKAFKAQPYRTEDEY